MNLAAQLVNPGHRYEKVQTRGKMTVQLEYLLANYDCFIKAYIFLWGLAY